MLKTTPLNAAHRALGARMVDFGGWDMPVNYGSQIEEHHAVRRDAGMFDVSHMLAIDLHGAGARDFLRRILANNADKLRDPGRALYSCMLNDEGGVIDDLIVYFFYRRMLSPGGECGQGGEGPRLARVAQGTLRCRARTAAAARSRHDRGAGPERARAGVAGAARDARGHRSDAILSWRAAGRVDAGAHRLHRRGRFRTHAAGRSRRSAVAATHRLPA